MLQAGFGTALNTDRLLVFDPTQQKIAAQETEHTGDKIVTPPSPRKGILKNGQKNNLKCNDKESWAAAWWALAECLKV